MAFAIQRDIVDVKVRIDGVNVDREDFTPPFDYFGWMYVNTHNGSYSVFIDMDKDEMIKYITYQGYRVCNFDWEEITFTNEDGSIQNHPSIDKETNKVIWDKEND